MSKYVLGDHLRLLTRVTSLVAPPTFLLPTIFHRSHYCTPQPRTWQRERTPVRRLAIPVPNHRLLHTVKTVEDRHEANDRMSEIFEAATTNPILWTCLLEPYLPRHLQRKERQEADAVFADADRPLPARNLHAWLAKARKIEEPAGDLLTYLLVKEDRHDAVVWLVEAMLKQHARHLQTSETLTEFLGVSRQPQTASSLDDVTASAGVTGIYLGVQRSSGMSLDHLTARAERSASHECIGEIWRAVGSMILQAADHKPTSHESKSIMTCVLRILALLHHFEAVPSSIYNQATALDPSVLQRPPTLYFWSLRIMTDLSDASFHSINPSPAAGQGQALNLYDANATHGEDSPTAARVQLVPEVEPQIWLDFVLWCCVDGGWITEAAEIVNEMRTRGIDGQQYSVIDWNTLRQQTAPKLPWTTRMRMAINGSRMREFAGGPTLGIYDERASPLKPPERTVSSEVIAAIVDALVTTASPISQADCAVVNKQINGCKIMLDRKRLGLGCNSWDSVMLRMAERLPSESEAVQTSRTLIEQTVTLSPPFLQEPASANSAYHSQSMAQAYVADPSAISVGLLHRRLLDFTLAGNFRAAFRILKLLQKLVDANRKNSFDNFPIMVSPNQAQDQEEAMIHITEQPQAPGLSPQLPAIVLGPFLELVTEVGDLELGRWLLYSNDVDGCIIPPNMYSDPVLHPALIGFASAAGDERLLESVMTQVTPPLSGRTLRALLHHQIRHGQWDGVREIFELFHDNKEMAWAPSDVLVLAGAILRHEKETPEISSGRPPATSPGTLLQRMMRGQYNTPHDPSRPRDLSQTRLLNQLARIIASVPSQLSRDLSPFCDLRSNVLSASHEIPTRAFNGFLSTVIELFGLHEGKQLCEQWCSFQDSMWPVKTPYVEIVVRPNPETFYVFLRRISHARTVNKQKTPASRGRVVGKRGGSPQKSNHVKENEQDIIYWAVAGCLDSGLSLERIQLDFPILHDACEDWRHRNPEIADTNRDDPWGNHDEEIV